MAFLLLLLAATPAAAVAAGGPDESGYVWGEADYDFVVLSPSDGGEGTPLSFPAPQGSTTTVELPWRFPFYDKLYHHIGVTEFGALILGQRELELSPANSPLPDDDAGAPDVAVFWDSLAPQTGSIAVLADDSAFSERFIVSWEGVAHTEAEGGASFQVHLYPNGSIAFHYADTLFLAADVSLGSSATIGLQDPTRERALDGHALQVSFDSPFLKRGGSAIWLYPCLDADEDGVFASHCGGTDCEDDNPSIPSEEIPYDGIDNDCLDGDLVDIDGDGFFGGPDGNDCADENPSIHPNVVEVCDDGFDNNCDGGVDAGGDDLFADHTCGSGCSLGGGQRPSALALLLGVLLAGRPAARGSRRPATARAGPTPVPNYESSAP